MRKFSGTARENSAGFNMRKFSRCACENSAGPTRENLAGSPVKIQQDSHAKIQQGSMQKFSRCGCENLAGKFSRSTRKNLAGPPAKI